MQAEGASGGVIVSLHVPKATSRSERAMDGPPRPDA